MDLSATAKRLIMPIHPIKLRYIRDMLVTEPANLDMKILIPDVPHIADMKSGCIAGWVQRYNLFGQYYGSPEYPHDIQYHRDMAINITREICGYDDRIWNFIFGSGWGNSITKAVDRINWIIARTCPPAYIDMANKLWIHASHVDVGDTFYHTLSEKWTGVGYSLIDVSFDGIVLLSDPNTNNAHIAKNLIGRTYESKEQVQRIINNLQSYTKVRG